MIFDRNSSMLDTIIGHTSIALTWAYRKIELLAFGGGAILGLTNPFYGILLKIVMAIITGGAATSGAHIAKTLINKFTKHGKES